MTNIQKTLNRMYVGFVYVHWSDGENTKLGTAKQKSIQQMKSFAETLDKSNPMTNTVKANIQKMSQDVSRQIMTDKSSEMVLDKKHSQEYKKLGEKQVAESKQELMQEMARVKQVQRPQQNLQTQQLQRPRAPQNSEQKQRLQFRANQNQSVAKIKDMQKQSNDQNMQARKVGAPYRATNTNAPEKGSQQVATLHKLDQKKLLEMFAYKRYQKTA